jgi:ribonuclease VapC
MIAVDASAILAMLFAEPEKAEFEKRLREADRIVMTPINLWEVLVRAQAVRGAVGRAAAEDLIAGLDVDIVAATESHAGAAADAFARFGRRTAANLNLGECFAYALAKAENCPLLFKGDDFGKTDIVSAI